MKLRHSLASLFCCGLLVVVMSACSESAQDSAEISVERQVLLSEIYYHAASDNDADDFVEIVNVHNEPVAVTGWCIKGVGFCFTDVTVLEPNEHLVVYGKSFSGRLGNKGERIRLVDAQDNVRDEVTYADSDPWPESADGDGDSLHRKNLNGDGNNADNWSAAPPSPGEEFAEGTGLSMTKSPKVVMTEILYNALDGNPVADFVELHNQTSQALALDGWCMSGSNACFAAGDVIEPHGFLVVSGLSHGVSLGNGGQTLQLIDDVNEIHDVVKYSDSDPWPALADGHGHSLQRIRPSLRGDSPAHWMSGEPTPGKAFDAVGVDSLALFTEVKFTQSPLPMQTVSVTATNPEISAAQLHYRYGFNEEVTIEMTKSDSQTWTASIPGSDAGTLIRFRLSGGNDTVVGQWPRQGDGAQYGGTVVKATDASPLPRLQWFMDPQNISAMNNSKRDLFGDTGFPAVFAYDGEIIDNALIRVKGQESRGRDKNKYKVTLPAGYEWDMKGLIETPINEFGLHSMLTDKSYSRELLTYDLQKVAGGMAQQVFPLRLELNNEFYGLYLYHEQPDGKWRDKYGFSDDVVAIKGERISTLKTAHLNRTDEQMNIDYRRQTQKYDFNQDEMRWLIQQLNQEESKVTEFIYKHVDIPQVVNALAVARVAQHVELEHKNWMLFFDPRDEKWRFQAIDHDLNFGKKWTAGCKSRCDEVFANPYLTYMQANRFTRSFVKVPEFRELLDRRTRTLSDAFLTEGIIESRLQQLHAEMEVDAILDKEKWIQYGIRQTLKEAQDLIVEAYAQPKRWYYIRDDEKYLPLRQTDTVLYRVDDSQSGQVRLTNTDVTSIDLSGIRIDSLEGRVPPGVVLLPGQSVVLTSGRVPRGDVTNNDIYAAIEPVAND